MPRVVEAIKLAFTQEELGVLREALTPLSESFFFSKAAEKYLSELAALESFTEFKVKQDEIDIPLLQNLFAGSTPVSICNYFF